MASQAPERGLFYPGDAAAAEAAHRAASPNPGADVVIEVKRGFWNRRTLLRFAGWGTLLALVGQWLAGFGVFFWPKKVGAFGGEILGGAVADFDVGEVERIQDGKCYVSRVPEGFLALWWKCPHLGCTVPWKPDDPSMDSLAQQGRFNCPATARSTTGTATSSPARRLDQWTCSACRFERGRSISTRTRPERSSARSPRSRATRHQPEPAQRRTVSADETVDPRPASCGWRQRRRSTP